MAISVWVSVHDGLPEVGRRVEVDRLPTGLGWSTCGVITNHPTTNARRVVFQPENYTSGGRGDNGWYISPDDATSATQWRYLDLPDASYEVTVAYDKKEKHMFLAAATLRVQGGHIPVIYRADSDGDYEPSNALIIWQGDLSKPYEDIKDDDGVVTKFGATTAYEVAQNVIAAFYREGIEAAAKKVVT